MSRAERQRWGEACETCTEPLLHEQSRSVPGLEELPVPGPGCGLEVGRTSLAITRWYHQVATADDESTWTARTPPKAGKAPHRWRRKDLKYRSE